MRAVLHALSRGPGAVARGEVLQHLHNAYGAVEALKALDVHVGQRWLVHGPTVALARRRWLCWRVAVGTEVDPLPDDEGVAPFRARWPPHMAAALGFVGVGGWLVRLDTYEDLLARGQEAAITRGVSQEALEEMTPHLPSAPRRNRRGRRR